MVSEDDLIKNRNASGIALSILYDFSIINTSKNLKQDGIQFLDGNMVQVKQIYNGFLLPNNNYIINLDILNLFNLNSTDFKNFNKDLLLTIIKSSLNYTDLKIHDNGWLELKLPKSSY